MFEIGSIVINKSSNRFIVIDIAEDKLCCIREEDASSDGMIVRHYFELAELSLADRFEKPKLEKLLRRLVIKDARTHASLHINHKVNEDASALEPKLPIHYGGRYYDEQEIDNLVNASLDFWLTSGKYCKEFEQKFCDKFRVKYCSLTNSGSSANLLAFMALTSHKLGERRIRKGDEVITVAAGFPTTVSPITQYGAVPVFVDVDMATYNIDITQLEAAVSSKTKAVMIAHTLGNPFDLKAVKDFCDKYLLWLIEDNCDALGSLYEIDGTEKYTGTIGDIGTSSFYPPHHMTMGEGGAIYTNNIELNRLVNSFRDWGRDCWCDSGVDDTCKNRFTKQYGKLPLGYDHKYVYSHFGYNLKATEMQASIGCAQIEKIDYIIERRRENWQQLRNMLKKSEDVLELPIETSNSKPSWFGFLITVKENASFTRNDLVKYLEKNGIQTRMLFAGNLLKHPCFIEAEDEIAYRVIGTLKNTDRIMNQTFWIGVYPGLNTAEISYMANKINEFVTANVGA